MSHCFGFPSPARWLTATQMHCIVIGVLCLSLPTIQTAYGATCSDISPLPQRRDLPSLVPGDRGADVRSLQTLLTLLGYYAGGIDGVFNEALTTAVKQFQTHAELPPTGQITSATWGKLLPHQLTSETCIEAP